MEPADPAAQPGHASTRRIRVAFAALFVLAVALALYVVWPFRTPLLLAAVLASALQRPFRRLTRLLRGRRTTAAVGMTLGLVLLLVGPLAAIVAFATSQVVKGLAFLRDELGIANVQQLARLKHGGLSPHGEALMDRLLQPLHLSRTQLGDLIGRAASGAEHAVSQLLASSWRATFHTAIMLLAFYFLLVEGSRLVDWTKRVSPLEARQTRDLLDEFRAVSRASILGTAITACFQALVATLGYVVTGVPHAAFFGLLTLVASFIPIVGTLLVWLPACAFLWLLDSHAAAALLCVWCLVLVVGAEHIGKPFALRAVLGGREEMHTGLVFLALLGGLEMFGLIGLVLGPLVFAFLLAMLRIYERDFRPRGAV